MKRPAAASKPVEIEIAPGVSTVLRRAAEFEEAIQNDFYQGTSCLCCGEELYVIANAAYVYCPACKGIGPIDHSNEEHQQHQQYQRHENNEKSPPPNCNYGLGMGVTLLTLMQIHRDVLARFSAAKSRTQSKPRSPR